MLFKNDSEEEGCVQKPEQGIQLVSYTKERKHSLQQEYLVCVCGEEAELHMNKAKILLRADSQNTKSIYSSHGHFGGL